jgi:hypothetical protein
MTVGAERAKAKRAMTLQDLLRHTSGLATRRSATRPCRRSGATPTSRRKTRPTMSRSPSSPSCRCCLSRAQPGNIRCRPTSSAASSRWSRARASAKCSPSASLGHWAWSTLGFRRPATRPRGSPSRTSTRRPAKSRRCAPSRARTAGNRGVAGSRQPRPTIGASARFC